MDDFEYSVRISEQDWDSFFLECEECNLLPPVLAGMEDSGMSDMDEIASYRARRVAESRVPDPELQTNSPDHAESPVDLYLSRYGATSPMQVLSGSEDDLHMETVNVFFERLKSVSASEDPLTQKHHSSVVGKMAGHLKGSVEVRDTKEIAVNSQAIQRNESTQTDDSYSSRYNNLAVNELEVVAELFIKDKDWSLTTIKDRMKCDELFKDTRPKSDTGKTPCCALVKGKDLRGPNQENSQLVTGGSSENSKELSIYRAEQTLSNINNIDKEKGKDQDVQQNFSSKDHKLSPSEIMEGMGSPTLDPVDGARNLEAIDAVSQPTHPVYAMSSFWNEMEKLTINDILRLRLVSQAQHPSVLLQPEDSGIADISDAADSGYFTHFDDSKPDRSSGDMSFISDFDEELSQLQTQEAVKLDEGSQESPNSGDAMWESDADPSGTGTEMEDVFMLSSETALQPPLYRDNAQQCFRKMCKNISVQNLQALEAEPFRKILRNASLLSLHSVHSTHSIHTEVEDDYVDPFDQVDASSPVCLSDEEEEMESAGITFSEIIQYLFGGEEPECCASTADNTAVSYLDGTGTSVPETYDHFFSEFEDGSLFYPLVDNTSSSKEELVPIFSCSRSVNTNLQFPEVYDYFFSDDSHSDEDEEHDQTVIQVFTRHDYIAAKSHNAVAASDTYEKPSPETDNSWNFLRNNPLSFRKVRRSDFTAPPENYSSWALTPVKNRRRSFQRGIQPINAMGPDEMPFPDPLLLNLENRIFGQLANQQKICSEMQTAVADPRVDAPLMPLKQADMCLVCIAFASWVLKSANPQGADMWKAALLANISALSAIRYLRRWTRDEAAKKAPLRQIEPA
ncbi:hypothetical protein MHYP_G00077960 [Metynnis hypsauchen]